MPANPPPYKPTNLRILAIETSCDETAVALVEFDCSVIPAKAGIHPTPIDSCSSPVANIAGMTGIQVMKNLVSSQIPIHQKYGGVVPEVAARSHVPETISLISSAIEDENFDAIAVTYGPGLPTALRVGVEAARTLAYATGKTIIGVNHLEGHLASAWLNEQNRKQWQFPLLALIVSGGHTELVLMNDYTTYTIIGETRDDAAGEAFDKSAKLLGLPYPGGPQIALHAKDGNPNAVRLPRPMLDDDTLDFSFSGLKTAVRLEWERSCQKICHSREGGNLASTVSDSGLGPRHRGGDRIVNNFCASVQQAIVDVLVEKTMRAAKRHHVHGILLVGGVSANEELRRQLGDRIKQDLTDAAFLPSDKTYITDNAAMIAAAGYWRLSKGFVSDWRTLDADPSLSL